MKRIVGIVVLALSLLLCGCATHTESGNVSETSRMVVVEQASIYYICYDKETKVMYAVSSGAYNGGTFTALLDSDGSPLLYKD